MASLTFPAILAIAFVLSVLLALGGIRTLKKRLQQNNQTPLVRSPTKQLVVVVATGFLIAVVLALILHGG